MSTGTVVGAPSAPLSLTQRRAEQLRRDVAFQARALFLERGDTDVTVELICERAGISVRTFHRHFRVKSEVVVPLFTSWYAEVKRRLDEMPGGIDLVAALAHLLAKTNTERPQTRRFLRIISADPEYRLRWMSVDGPFAEAVEECLVERGLALKGFEARLAAGLIVHASRVAYAAWLDGDEGQDHLESLMLHAMGSATAAWPQAHPSAPNTLTSTHSKE